MRALNRLETFLHDLVERPAWLLMPRRLPPLVIASALTREVESRALPLADRVILPDHYDVLLSPADWESLAGVHETLEAELGTYVSRLAAERGLTLRSPPQVRLRVESGVRQGDVAVEGSFRSGGEGASVRPVVRPVPQTPAAFGVTEHIASPRPKQPETASASPALVLVGADGRELRRYALDRSQLTIGRRSNNDIALSDTKLSREHARIDNANGSFYITDLGSTNGTLVNGDTLSGRRLLRAGDVVEIGLQRFRFEAQDM